MKKKLGNVDQKLKKLEKKQKAHEKEDDMRFSKVKSKKKKLISIKRV
jgi:hypothetical protein